MKHAVDRWDQYMSDGDGLGLRTEGKHSICNGCCDIVDSRRSKTTSSKTCKVLVASYRLVLYQTVHLDALTSNSIGHGGSTEGLNTYQQHLR